ncbi:GH92 family glycosyl hydrolase [Planosporangium sp. 12N6]|uniref:GH92 family glycosyl hydrolase n=1 Tax=Planosporangium spinosum TaxID=3402278 RepID=UPI003CE74DC9
MSRWSPRRAGRYTGGFGAVLLTATLTCAVPAAAAAPALVTDPAALVNPFIGTTNLGNTYPGAVTPFGMLAWSPQNTRGDQTRTAAPGGYEYTVTKLRGLSLTHVSGVGCSGANGDIPILPYVGDVTTSPTADTTDATYASTFSHTAEAARPGYYKVGLDSDATAEVTTTPRTGSGRFTFPADRPASLLFRTAHSETGSSDATVRIDAANRTVTGSVTAGNFCGPQSPDNRKPYYTLHFTAHFDQPFAAVGTWTDATLNPGATTASGGTGYGSGGRPVPGKGSGGYVTFAPGTTRVDVKVAVSYVSLRNAEANLRAENPPGRSFDSVRTAAYADWRRALRRLGVGGGTADQRTVFYTALYHTMLEPTLTSDVTGEYAGADGAVHRLESRQRAQYGTFSGWDVYRAQVQLLALLDPKMASDYAQSLYNYARQRGGEWDRWLLQHGKTSVMSGDPAAAAIAAMYAFGARDFDVRGAYASLVTAATVPTANDTSDAGCPVECVGQRPALDRYLSLGYVPADDCHCWGGAAETLEDAAADFGLAELAKALGDTANHQRFLARSGNWRNVFDPDAAADPGLPHNVRAHVVEVTASAENPPGEGKQQLVDGDKGTKWLAFATTGWVQVQLDQPRTVTEYAVTSANDVPERDPKDWTLLGSADGVTWTAVDTRTGQAFTDRGVTNRYPVADPKPYRYYRLDVTANRGAPIVQVAELELADPDVPTPPPVDGPFRGYMRDRNADGTWTTGFTPSTERGFVEGSSARYTWMVYSDVVGLARLMGGNQVAIDRLDAFFRAPDGSFDFSGRQSTRYDPTNEPDIQAPFLYNYLGVPYKTQETVRAELDTLWTNAPGGIPGNDDAGTMSAKYVFAALGLYPAIPTRADLVLSSPLFPRATVELAGGRKLTIDAPQASPANRYIQRLVVGGRASSKPWIPAELLRTGGRLVYTLGPTANTGWGSAPGDVPPQFPAP